jgi:hypothetical protein
MENVTREHEWKKPYRRTTRKYDDDIKTNIKAVGSKDWEWTKVAWNCNTVSGF